MNKIPCLFEREIDSRGKILEITPVVTPGCEWVLAGEGVATVKFDGTACAVIDGKFYKRLDLKNQKDIPAGWIPCARLERSSSKPGWFPVGDGPEDARHREAWGFTGEGEVLIDGTYELVGPKVQGNPYKLERHQLMRHGSAVLEDAPRGFNALAQYLAELDEEGAVFHHPDGRMAKIRRKDFGYAWPVRK